MLQVAILLSLLIKTHSGDEFQGDYKFSNCIDNPVINILKIEINPKQFTIPQSISLSFDFNITRNVQLTKIHLNIYKDLPWIGFTKLPCIFDYGSCTYENICKILEFAPKTSLEYRILCPQWLKKSGFVCKCPFKQGHYSVDNAKVTIEDNFVPKWIVSGDYNITTTLKENDVIIACYNIQIRLL